MFEIETYVVEVAVLMNDWTLVDGDVLLMFELHIGLAVAVLINHWYLAHVDVLWMFELDAGQATMVVLWIIDL